ncbi:hypothetical protein EDB87DRAFT_1626741 [Lactarius vividus]|nr:hypothetical protein EDB87DRAFT_1626741 [Lactarius vividus]
MLSSPLFHYSANGPDPDLNTTMGMLLIGLILDTMLYGIVFFQTYLYFTSGARDRTSLRALVVVLWTLDTLQLALLCHATYYFLVLCNGHPDELARSVWSLNLEIAPSVIATFMVRCFFTVRLWHRKASHAFALYVSTNPVAVSHGNRFLICTITAFALPQLGIGLGMCVTSFQEEKFSELPKYMGLMTAQMSAAATADILITGPLLYYLKKSKDQLADQPADCVDGEYGTPYRVRTSLRKCILSSRTSCCDVNRVVETAQVISWVSATKTLIFLPFHLILAKLYTCSMLAMLNGRRGLRQTFDEPTHTLPRHRSSIVISLHGDDTGPILNETGPLEFSNPTYPKFEVPTSVSLFPERPRRDVNSGGREHSPEMRDVHGT